MIKPNILFFHPSGLFYGGTEKLLQIFAKVAAVQGFNAFFAYSPKDAENRKSYFDNTGVTLVPFEYSIKQGVEPYTPLKMRPTIFEIIEKYHIELICTPVSSHYQFPLNVVPASMPFILTSPFGHYASNGNVQRIYVSGSKNLERVRARGVDHAELIYDPLEDFPENVTHKQPVGETVVFGRLGRADDQIFDPISIRAFARLEQKYGSRVQYLVLSPPPKMRAMAQQLGLKNFVVVDEKLPDYWLDFYKRVDILAHARLDGETFGKAIAEAMLAGLPIITHKSKFHNEHLHLLDPSYAKCAEIDDVNGYYAAMEWFVEHRDQVRPMGQLAREKALSMFSVERIMPPILAEFRRAAAKCTYYEPQSAWSGYARLWFENMKMFPFVFAKKLAYRFPWVNFIATKLYNKRPLY